jgi:hypothetical protein
LAVDVAPSAAKTPSSKTVFQDSEIILYNLIDKEVASKL